MKTEHATLRDMQTDWRRLHGQLLSREDVTTGAPSRAFTLQHSWSVDNDRDHAVLVIATDVDRRIGQSTHHYGYRYSYMDYHLSTGFPSAPLCVARHSCVLHLVEDLGVVNCSLYVSVFLGY